MASITSDALWPELYGISLRRPMLEVSRAQIRQYLKVHNLSFIDDPSNEDINFSRVRARRILARDPRLRGEMLALGADLRAGRAAEMKYLAAQLGAGVIVDGFGCIHLRARVAPYLLARLLRAVSGGRVLADQAALERLSCAMGAADFKGATLGGAMIKPTPALATNPAINCKFVLSRDPSMALGRVGRPALGPITTPASQSLWDGRFLVHGGANIQPAAGHLGKLSQQLKKQLKACPSQARPTLPLIKDGTGILAIGPINAGKDEGSCMQTAVHMRLSREFADTEIKFMRTVHY
jgi:tRNA(Ile)-lysidine synthase